MKVVHGIETIKMTPISVPKQTYIGIYLSTTCEKSTSCPNYKELADQFDSSNRYLSGEFSQDKEGIWHREKPRLKNIFEYYRQGMGLHSINIFVDPDAYTAKYVKVITIEPSIPVYIDNADMKMKLNNTSQQFQRIERHGFHIDGCSSAQIGWKENGAQVLADMVNHFYRDCAGTFPHDPVEKIYIPRTVFTDCGKWCEYTKWMADAKERSKDISLIGKE